MNAFLRIMIILWASPYSLIGLAVGCLGICSGGKAQVREGVLEFYGGGTRWFVSHLPLGKSTVAITLGHTILGQTAVGLDCARRHEHVHVRQFQRWGPFLGPAYLGASLYLWLAGRSPYRDNPFEREAYDACAEEQSPRG